MGESVIDLRSASKKEEKSTVTDANIDSVDLDSMDIEDAPMVAGNGSMTASQKEEIDKTVADIKSLTSKVKIIPPVEECVVVADPGTVKDITQRVTTTIEKPVVLVEEKPKRRRRRSKISEVVGKTKELLRFNKGKVDLTQLGWLPQFLESLVFMYGEFKYARNN